MGAEQSPPSSPRAPGAPASGRASWAGKGDTCQDCLDSEDLGFCRFWTALPLSRPRNANPLWLSAPPRWPASFKLDDVYLAALALEQPGAGAVCQPLGSGPISPQAPEGRWQLLRVDPKRGAAFALSGLEFEWGRPLPGAVALRAPSPWLHA